MNSALRFPITSDTAQLYTVMQSSKTLNIDAELKIIRPRLHIYNDGPVLTTELPVLMQYVDAMNRDSRRWVFEIMEVAHHIY